MKILHDTEDRFHGIDAPGGYEWTYFDGLSEDGELGFVAIWFRGIPMSPYYTAAIDRSTKNPSSHAPVPSDYCAFTISVYHKGKCVFSALHERPRDLFAGSTDSADVRLASNSVHSNIAPDGTKSFYLTMDTELPYQLSRLVGDITVTSSPQELGNLTTDYDDATASGHYWVPAALDGTFTARLDIWKLGRGMKKYRFSGRCYHDRNFGTEPLHHLPVNWHWGRLHFDSKTFVYFNIVPDAAGEEHFQQVLLLEDGKLIARHEQFVMEELPRKRHWTTLSYPSGITARDEPMRFDVSAVSLLDSGPFYHRMLSRITVQDSSGTSLIGTGITEFLRPSRLGIGAFRPFVKFRMRRR